MRSSVVKQVAAAAAAAAADTSWLSVIVSEPVYQTIGRKTRRDITSLL